MTIVDKACEIKKGRLHHVLIRHADNKNLIKK